MSRWIALAVLYLAVAVALEFAVLDQILASGGWWTGFFDWRLLSLAGIAWGFSRGDGVGLAMGLAAAMAYGLSQSAGQLGASMVSFALTGWLAGVLSTSLRPQSAPSRFALIYALLFAERVVWSLIRIGLGLGAAFDLPWLGLAVTAAFALALTRPPKR